MHGEPHRRRVRGLLEQAVGASGPAGARSGRGAGPLRSRAARGQADPGDHAAAGAEARAGARYPSPGRTTARGGDGYARLAALSAGPSGVLDVERCATSSGGCRSRSRWPAGRRLRLDPTVTPPCACSSMRPRWTSRRGPTCAARSWRTIPPWRTARRRATALVTDARGIEVSLDAPLAAGSILRVLGRARRGPQETDADA